MKEHNMKMTIALCKSMFQIMAGATALLIFTPVCAQTSSQQSAKAQDMKQATLQLKGLIEEQCQSLGVKYPFTSRQLRTRESTAFVEQAIENGISSCSGITSKVSINGDHLSVEIRPQHPYYVQGWWGDAEALVSALEEYRAKLDRLRNIESVLVEAIALMFTEKVQLAFQVITSEMQGDWAITAQGDASSKDLLGHSGGKIDYQAEWIKIKNAVRANGLSINRDTSSQTKFSLNTPSVGSMDDNWLYQSFRTISMWDPYARDPQHSGEYLTVDVVFVVKKRKELGPFIPSIRSGPEEDRIVRLILDGIRAK
jgi:hypothetical protein